MEVEFLNFRHAAIFASTSSRHLKTSVMLVRQSDLWVVRLPRTPVAYQQANVTHLLKARGHWAAPTPQPRSQP